MEELKQKTRKTQLASFTLKHETIRRLEEMVKQKSINKSAFVDRLINEEIDREIKNK